MSAASSSGSSPRPPQQVCNCTQEQLRAEYPELKIRDHCPECESVGVKVRISFHRSQSMQTGAPSSLFADVLEKLSNKMDLIEKQTEKIEKQNEKIEKIEKQNEKIEKKVDETSKMDEKLAMDVERLEKKVDETNNKRRSIAISDISSGSWKEIEARGYQITPHEWTDALTTMLEPSCTVTSSSSSSPCAPFHWDEQQSEPQQIDSYTQYIRDQLKLPRNILLRPAPAHLLDTTSPILPFDVSGTTDLILVERAAIRGLVPASGVRVIIEVKKALTEDSKRAQYQAMLELITADLSSAFCPIALLTDLQDTFIFSWLDWEKERMLRNYIHVLVPPSRSLAFRLLNHLTAQFNSEKDEMKTAADAILEQLPVPISKRRKLSIIPEQRYTDHDDEEEDDERVHESAHHEEWRRPLLLDDNDTRPEWHRPTMLEREGLPVIRRKLAQWIRNSPSLMKGFITHDSQDSLRPVYQSMFS